MTRLQVGTLPIQWKHPLNSDSVSDLCALFVFLCFVLEPLPPASYWSICWPDRVERGSTYPGKTSICFWLEPIFEVGTLEDALPLLRTNLFNMFSIRCDQVSSTGFWRCPPFGFKTNPNHITTEKRKFKRPNFKEDQKKLMMKMKIPCRPNSIHGPGIAGGQSLIDTGKLNPLGAPHLLYCALHCVLCFKLCGMWNCWYWYCFVNWSLFVIGHW